MQLNGKPVPKWTCDQTTPVKVCREQIDNTMETTPSSTVLNLVTRLPFVIPNISLPSFTLQA
jgi:hypothetical protein